ncbi:MAG: class II fumarate hydratase [Myxococcota bacterium]|nr:class II fumarate hydratase [Myxococcota bacterium]
MKTRIEKDTMGEMAVPAGALYGPQTARAVENFPISGVGIGREMIRALGLIKKAAARINQDLGKLPSELCHAISTASDVVISGRVDDHFPVDVFQTGSGTSSNMNINEVIATLANRQLNVPGGSEGSVHPNDHVNMGQSSNDVFPTAIHLAALAGIEHALVPALKQLFEALQKKTTAYNDIIKIGRTHLQDATPIRLGQEFSGFAAQIAHGIAHVEQVAKYLRALPIGGTAVGTGINTDPSFGRKVTAALTQETGIRLTEAPNHFEAQSARDGTVRMSGALKSLAVSLMKIAGDIRWLGSGPRLGLAELKLPPVQPGSSIMPGKVNPVIAEAMIQVAAQVVGNDAAICAGGMMGRFQLNTMQPLMARNLLEQIHLLANGVRVFTERLIIGIEPNIDAITARAQTSLGLATALAPHIGYDRAAEIAKTAEKQGKTIREVAGEQGILSPAELDELLDLKHQV